MSISARKVGLPGRALRRFAPGRGFTLVEALVSVFVIGLVATLGLPNLFQYIHRVKIEGINRETRGMLQQARFEAIKRAVPAVVAIDPNTREIVSFVDVHGPTLGDPSDGVFNPQAAPFGATDFEVARYQLPTGVDFRFQADTGLASVDGFVNIGNPDPPDKRAIFKPNGSAVAAGAFRLADERGNYLEVRLVSTSAARIEVRKWDGAAWKVWGEGGEPWIWY